MIFAQRCNHYDPLSLFVSWLSLTLSPFTMDLQKLAEPFDPSDIEWRIGQAGKGKSGKMYAKVLAYLTSRAVMQRLDDVCSPLDWKNEFSPGPSGGIVCCLSIWDEEKQEWIGKCDGADNTDIEAVKGGLSDSLKRAGVLWGIGRYLYNLGETFAECSETKNPGWNYAKSKDGMFWWKTPSLPAWALPIPQKVIDAASRPPLV